MHYTNFALLYLPFACNAR